METVGSSVTHKVKLGTNGVVYSTNGIFVGNDEDFAKANFSVDVNGALKAAGGKVRTEEEQSKFTFKAGNLLITTDKNDEGQLYQNITFSDSNATGYEITLAEIVDTSNRTKTVATRRNFHGNGVDTYTSIGGKLKVYDKHKVGTGDNTTETSIDLVTIKGDLSVDDSNTDTKIETEDNSKFYVKGEDGSLKAANGNFTVDKNGNTVAKGSLSVADGKFKVNTDGTLTTKKLITDELVITGNGAAGGITGTGSIAFGGNGTIKSNIKEGSKETTFETTVDKVNTKVTNGTNTTTVTTTASGTTFTKVTDFTNSPNTTIDGSTITSKNGTATGTLNGSNLTLKDGSSKTDIKAGGATFTKAGKTTTIDGGNIFADGTLSVAGGKFTIGADGSFSAADGNFKIDNTGTMTAGSIKMDKIEAADSTKGIDVGGVKLKDKSITAADGKFKVDADGKVIINEGEKNQVRIDSNGIKVGNNSAFISDDGFKSSGDLYIGTKTAPTENATDARFYVKGSDGSVKAADGKFTVEADGGFTAADGKFKVTGDGNLEVKDAAGNSKSINLSDVADMGQDIARMNNRISDVSDRVNKVGAMSAALASLKTIGYDPEAPTEFSVGLGQYKGESGVALGIFHYPNKNFLLNLSLSTAGGETMGGIGATWRIGHGAPQKQLEVAIKEDVEKVIVKKEDYDALQEQVNQLTQLVQQLVADKEAAASK